MNKINYFSSFNKAYFAILTAVMDEGKHSLSRPGSSLGSTKELLDAAFSIPATRPLCTIRARKLNYAFALLEPFYLFTNQCDANIAAALCEYAPNLKSLALNELGEFEGNYGDRIGLCGPSPAVQRNQLYRVYDLLQQDVRSRRAIVTIHNPIWDLVHGNSNDIPCTLSLQFLFRDNKLDCYATMRSNDAWYGTPHNVLMFTFLQRSLASWLGVEVGIYHHRATSLHIYSEHFKRVENLLKNPELRPGKDSIFYPMHSCPDYTFGAAKRMIKWEHDARTSGKRDHDFIDAFEDLVARQVLAHHLANKK